MGKKEKKGKCSNKATVALPANACSFNSSINKMQRNIKGNHATVPPTIGNVIANTEPVRPPQTNSSLPQPDSLGTPAQEFAMASAKDEGAINFHNQLIKLADPLGVDFLEHDGTEIVINNLQLIAKFLLELSESLITKTTPIDTLKVVGLHHTLPYYSKLLPEILKTQLEAARYFLPTHVVEDSSILGQTAQLPSTEREDQ